MLPLSPLGHPQAFYPLVDLSPALTPGHNLNPGLGLNPGLDLNLGLDLNPSLGLNFPCPASLLGPAQRFLNQVPLPACVSEIPRFVGLDAAFLGQAATPVRVTQVSGSAPRALAVLT